MMKITTFLAATAAIGSLAAPAAAQYYPQQPTYPQYQQQYPQAYGYGQQYGQVTTGNPVADMIDSLLGNRYNVNDRQAVRSCVNAARAQAAAQYSGGYSGYNNNGYRQQGYAGTNLRVTSITGVERRSRGLRVSGTLGSAYAGQYGQQYGNYGGYDRQHGYQNEGQAYGGASVNFRCNVAYNGAVTGVRIGRY